MSPRASFAEPRLGLTLPGSSLGVLSGAERSLLRDCTELLLARPTAPYAEDLAIEAIRAFVDARPGLEFELAAGANVLVHWRGSGRSRRRAPLAFSAHLDHPGFLYQGRRAGKHRAHFHGGVPARCMPGAGVRFFDARSAVTTATARVASVARTSRGELEATLQGFRGKASRGSPGMWDLPAGLLTRGRLRARVCDDLLGAAAVLALLDRARAEGLTQPLLGIFTRAEETGFVGCQALLRAGVLPRGSVVVGLECSPRRASARVGAGPVLRVGDAASIFDPEITRRLAECAAAIAGRVEGFRVQRALMDGGRCESTAYNLWGVPAGGLCLALGGYHNVVDSGAGRGTIGPEFVDWNDFEGLLALLLEAARSWGRAATSDRMRERLDGIWAGEKSRYDRSAARITRRIGG